MLEERLGFYAHPYRDKFWVEESNSCGDLDPILWKMDKFFLEKGRTCVGFKVFFGPITFLAYDSALLLWDKSIKIK